MYVLLDEDSQLAFMRDEVIDKETGEIMYHGTKKTKRNKKKINEMERCVFCGYPIVRMTGGFFTIPISVTGYHSQKVCLHNRCLKPFLKALGKGKSV